MNHETIPTPLILALIASLVGLLATAAFIYAVFRTRRHEFRPAVLWFTGLSGAGKTTLALALFHELKRHGQPVEHLDGDLIRSIFPRTGFTHDAREEHIKHVAYLASMLEKNGVTVIVSMISPYESSRAFARNLCANFVEVHLSTPLSECERRDPKGLYKRARSGEIQNFTGISDPYEPPKSPEVAIDTSNSSVEQATRDLLATMKNRSARR